MEHFAYGFIENMIRKEDRIALTEVTKQLENPLIPNTNLNGSNPSSEELAINKNPTVGVSRDSAPFGAIRRGGNIKWILLMFLVILLSVPDLSPLSYWKMEKSRLIDIIQIQLSYHNNFENINALGLNVNGTQLAAGYSDGTVVVRSYPSGRIVFRERNTNSGFVTCILWNPFRPDVLATRGLLGDLVFWNLREENGNAEKANHFFTLDLDEYIFSVAWISANQIAIGLPNDEIEICEVEIERRRLSFLKTNSRVIKRFKLGDDVKEPITGLQWNERTKYLASSSAENKWIKIWSMDSDQPVHTLQFHSGCRKLAWRPNVKSNNDGGIDGERKDKDNFFIAGGLEDGSIVLWNPLEEEETKRTRILPQKHSHGVEALLFSPDGQFLASNGGLNDEDELIIIWSTETWQPVFTFRCQLSCKILSWISTDSSFFPTSKLAVYLGQHVFVAEESLDMLQTLILLHQHFSKHLILLVIVSFFVCLKFIG